MARKPTSQHGQRGFQKDPRTGRLIHTPYADPEHRRVLYEAGKGTVTSLTAGAGITLTPNPITDSGTIAQTTTGVVPGTYGDATHVGQFTVDAQGNLTFAQNVLIGGVVAGSTEFNYYPWVGSAGGEFNAAQSKIDRIIMALATGAVPLASSTFQNGQYVAWPFLVKRTLTITQWKIDHRSGATAGAKSRLGIWTNDTAGGRRYPLTFQADINEWDLSTAAPAIKTITQSFQFLAGTLYWLAYNSNNNTPSIRNWPAANMEPMFTDDVSPGNAFDSLNCFTRNSAYGAISGNFPQTAATGSRIVIPMILGVVGSIP